MLVKFGNTGFQKFLWGSNWSDFLGIFFNSVITKWTACSPNTQKSWREAQMTGKFVILFLQKSEAEKTNKMAKQSLPPFELPTNFKKRDHMSCSSLVITFMIKRFRQESFFFSLCLFTQLQEGTNDNLLGVIRRKASREGPASMLFGALCYRNRNTLRSWGISLDSCATLHLLGFTSVKESELFLCFAPFVFLGAIVLTSLFPLFYGISEFQRFFQPEKTADISQRHHCFHREMT